MAPVLRWVGAAALVAPVYGGRHTLRTTLRQAPVEPSLCGNPESPVEQLSGYFQIKDDISVDKNYFYWFFESEDDPSNDPVILWLTGGPGCSSTLALFVENGPCTVDADGKSTTPRAESWNTRANVIWVDQPAGVGFSYAGTDADYDHNEEEVGEDMYWFLREFLAANPKYAANDFYVFGESYGGHYAPAVSHRVWHGNKDQQGAAAPAIINLKGVGIGNGLTAPSIQYSYYSKMATDNPYGIQAVSAEAAESMRAHEPPCVELIELCAQDDSTCSTAQTYCDSFVTQRYYETGLNPYDIRLPCGEADLCYDFTAVEKFLRLDSTRAALQVTEESAPWESCNNKVNADFSGDWMKAFDGYLPPMLKDGISVLIYAGDCDFICNFLGNEAWTLALEWEGKEGFNSAPEEDWVPDIAGLGGDTAGKLRTYGGLTFLQIFEAGHMVPMDQPAMGLSMLHQFTHGDGFERHGKGAPAATAQA